MSSLAVKKTKICNKCSQELPLTNFSPNKTKPDGVAYHCKPCGAARARERRKTTPLSEDQKEVARVRSANWRKENPVRNSEMKKSWRLRNLHTKKAANARYRSSKINATPNWLEKDHLDKIREFYWLVEDIKKTSGLDYHVDHIIPLKGESVCGLHVPWNLQILPADINLSKKNKL